ncbi:sugar phosphate isomerase/epimerase family protein [Mucilaginibacter sp. X5P1]|uniref:sugar phosphate isomerase/epimerase family protein n=1 Tax=Mucilaginibacter sp. X5P1 TaxID=2723088 RepID=UPI00160DCD30|nr:sugar phosphate isomerase/epimerase [Mucilaginibacter sp. X5P1]MBB6137310.1 sugar phosphate isomerase/epimerase [Mucilaginibacter sp. X5P1]
MTNRRTFLTQAGLVSAGLMIAPELLKAMGKNRVVGLQLYSLRDQIKTDVKGVIAKVAAAGYKEVEPFGYSKADGFWGLNAQDFSKLLKDNGLSTPSGHFEFDSFLGAGKTDELKTYIEAANITGMEYVIVPHLNDAYIKTVSDFNNIADKLNKAGELCKQSGLKLGYHNHNFEWKPVDGTTFYDTILAKTDPALVSMEMDLYWVVRTGQDPKAIIKAHPGRFFAFHIKDMDKTNHEKNTEVGNGTIDFKSIMGYAKLGGIKHFIVEQENYTDIDPYVSITKSCAYVKSILNV